MHHDPNPFGALIGFAIALVIGLVALTAYLVPSIVAVARGHSNRMPIILLNVLLGWSGLVWLVCLVWSFSSNTDRRHAELTRSR